MFIALACHSWAARGGHLSWQTECTAAVTQACNPSCNMPSSPGASCLAFDINSQEFQIGPNHITSHTSSTGNIEQCCRLWKQAYYNASNCEALVSCAAELQGLVLGNSSLAARPTLMANLLEAVTEVKEFIATFSER